MPSARTFCRNGKLDLETVSRAAVIAVDSLEQARLEAGDLLQAVERGVRSWDSMIELGRIVTGQVPSRLHPNDITLFKSTGIAIEDVAVALRVYELARARGMGEPITLWAER